MTLRADIAQHWTNLKSKAANNNSPDHAAGALISYVDPNDPLIKRAALHLVELVCGRRKLEKLYHIWKARKPGEAVPFWGSALEQMGIDLTMHGEAWPPADLDQNKATVVIANHPYGLLDGVAICALAEQLGKPFKILVNDALMRVPEVEQFFLPVDFNETRQAMKNNMQTKKEALQFLADGGVIVIFPAGGVSTADKPFGKADDLPWKTFTARLIQSSGATVLPLYFPGQNRPIFHAASKFSDKLRVALLIGELRRRLNKPLHVTVGEAVEAERLAPLPDRKAVMDALRKQVYDLAS